MEKDIPTGEILFSRMEEQTQFDICRGASMHLNTVNEFNLHNSNYQCSGSSCISRNTRLMSIISLISGIVRRIEIVSSFSRDHTCRRRIVVVVSSSGRNFYLWNCFTWNHRCPHLRCRIKRFFPNGIRVNPVAYVVIRKN